MAVTNLIERLETEWSLEEGFLGLLREGRFSDDGLSRLLNLLDEIKPSESEFIERRLVELLWYMPIFMGWQKERLQENGISPEKLSSAITEVENRLEIALGVP